MTMRFDPTINLGHVLTFAGFMVSGFAAYGVMDKRVAVLEESRANQVTIDRRQDEDRAEMRRSNREDFKEINSKLDRILIAAQTMKGR
jgi:low affinity Fe/Cu permease